jgi:hypothetical protein
MLSNFPLFLISFAIYNMIVFLTPGVAWSDVLLTVPMQSGAEWVITLGDGLMMISLLFLFIGVLRATRAGNHSMFDHALGTVIFAAAVAEFLLVPEAATSVFAILLLIALIEVLGGWSVAFCSARRDLTVEAMPDPMP